MECFEHEGTAAVGLCKFCARGVCRACAVPVTDGLACSQAHAPMAEALTQVQLLSIRNTGMQRYMQPLAALGLAAIGLGYAYVFPGTLLGWIFLVFGVLAGTLSGLALFRKR